MTIAQQFPDRREARTTPKLAYYDSCAACRVEQHSQHENKPESSPVIFCHGCKGPTRHRFTRSMPATGASMSAVHLLWACTACEGERVFGCVG